MTWPLVSMMTEPSLKATDLRCFCSTYMDQGSGLVTPGGGTKRKLEKNVTSGNKKKERRGEETICCSAIRYSTTKCDQQREVAKTE